MTPVDDRELLECRCGEERFEDGDALHRLQVDATRCRASAEVGEFDDLAKRLKEQIAKRGQLTDGRDVTEPFDHPRFEVDQLANLRQKCEIPSAPQLQVQSAKSTQGHQEREIWQRDGSERQFLEAFEFGDRGGAFVCPSM